MRPEYYEPESDAAYQLFPVERDEYNDLLNRLEHSESATYEERTSAEVDASWQPRVDGAITAVAYANLNNLHPQKSNDLLREILTARAGSLLTAAVLDNDIEASERAVRYSHAALLQGYEMRANGLLGTFEDADFILGANAELLMESICLHQLLLESPDSLDDDNEEFPVAECFNEIVDGLKLHGIYYTQAAAYSDIAMFMHDEATDLITKGIEEKDARRLRLGVSALNIAQYAYNDISTDLDGDEEVQITEETDDGDLESSIIELLSTANRELKRLK